MPSAPTWIGVVRHLHLTPRASLPMRAQDSLTLIAGKGIVGDRYTNETGYYSERPEEGRQITLFEEETLEALRRDHGIDLFPAEHRRNVTTFGVPLTHLVGRRFWLGEALLEATRLSVPCKHLEEVTGKPVFNPLINRSGLNAKILVGGTVRVGDRLSPEKCERAKR
ncbi:MOSC domain-containing protein [Bradyrhizobium sp. CCH5-F6]|uniref:MOSC domain-containing protein n=1 Tax=Bradyrhizobium sp. CCH5-F6 TaxID=1768753 RepID=UPI00076A0BC3|nr:MOSC domain-containing protein [Bradyrhizobium sp. CCH5-F6]